MPMVYKYIKQRSNMKNININTYNISKINIYIFMYNNHSTYRCISHMYYRIYPESDSIILDDPMDVKLDYICINDSICKYLLNLIYCE